jgi:hypothetical protein
MARNANAHNSVKSRKVGFSEGGRIWARLLPVILVGPIFANMFWRTALSSGLLLVSPWLCSMVVLAQTDQSLSPCTSSSAKSGDTSVKPRSDAPKVIIDEVRFTGPIHLAESVVNGIIAEWNAGDEDTTNEAWLNGFVEVGIRSAWQDRGYFRVTIGRAEAEPLGGDLHEQHFRVTVPINEGLQYHLGDVTFVDANPYSQGELREIIPLRDGEIFDISTIRRGIEALNKKYTKIGFVDFTAVPKTEVDDKLQRISLTFELDKQKQYRIRVLSVVGLDPPLEKALRSKMISGDFFDPTVIDDFVKQNRSSLPGNLNERDYLHETRNISLGTVDLSFDFRTLDSRGCLEAIP